MRGYFSFILVFASVLLLLNLFHSFSDLNDNYSKEIAIEKAYQLQLNAKEAIMEAARQGARQGLIEYTLLHAIEGDYSLEDARDAARKKAFERISTLHGWEFEPEFEVKIWCGATNDNELAKLKNKMLSDGKAQTCAGCLEINEPECEDYVNVDFDVNWDIVAVWLGNNKDMGILDTGLVGVSVYSDKFRVSGVSYIPQSEKHGFVLEGVG